MSKSLFFWCRHQESNSGTSDYKSFAINRLQHVATNETIQSITTISIGTSYQGSACLKWSSLPPGVHEQHYFHNRQLLTIKKWTYLIMYWWGGCSSCFNLLPSPFLLIAFGFSNSWILLLITLSEWFRPFFIVLALIALCFAYKQIWHPELVYNPGQIRATPQVKRTYRAYFLFVTMLVVIVLMIPYFISSIN